jgi:hypothetical protein
MCADSFARGSLNSIITRRPAVPVVADHTPRLSHAKICYRTNEGAIGVVVLNRMLAAARPRSVRRPRAITRRAGAGCISPSIRQAYQRRMRAQTQVGCTA